MKNLIYGLRDPRTQEIRYVGKSTSGLTRPRAHFYKRALVLDTTYKGNWVRSVIADGFLPEIVILQFLKSSEGLAEAEKWWIAIGKTALNSRFTNLTDGGDGCVGRKASVETRKKRSVSLKAYMSTAEGQTARSKTMLAVQNTPSVRNKKVVSMTQAWTREDERERRLAKIHDPEIRAKRIEAQKAAFSKPETREKFRSASRQVWERPGHREENSRIAKAVWERPGYREMQRNSRKSAHALRVVRSATLDVTTGVYFDA